MYSLLVALIATKMQLFALQATTPETVTEYVETPVYITEYVPYYVEVEKVEYVETEPQYGMIQCAKCGKVEEFGLMTEDENGLHDVCYNCWLENGETGLVSVMVEVENGEEVEPF